MSAESLARRFALGAAAAVLLTSIAIAQQSSTPAPAQPLRPVASFAGIADPAERSAALFTEAGRVLQSPRCLNCHPRTDRPTQTAAMTPHQPLVVRGPRGHGAAAMHCATCHGTENFDPAGVPGAPDWHLAPAAMAWQGKSLGEICALFKDPARNGNRTLAMIVDHAAHDKLVGWGWHPGGNRAPAPGTQAAFGALLEAWAATGAACPGTAAPAGAAAQ